MPIQELIRIRESKDLERNAALALAINCAPLLKNNKAANIITVTLDEFNVIKKLVGGTDISFHLLKARDGKFIIYLYRKNELLKYLKRDDVREFLEKYGYDTDNLAKMLVRLSIRSKAFCAGEEFPHEIGAFLGYPIKDIQGFLVNKGENFIYSGYWKVYDNVENTVRLFKKFDEDRETAVQELVHGKTIRQICC